MSIDLPFWYNVYDQINIPERSNAHGHYTLFTSVNPISLSTELLADKLYLQIHSFYVYKCIILSFESDIYT